MKRFVRLRQRDRLGFSLIECILYIFLLSTVGMLGFKVLSRLLRIDVAGSRLEDAQRQRTRLERTWRDDVHRAEEIVRPAMDGASDEIELVVEGTRILYTASGEGSVMRRARRNEAPAAVERWDVDGSVRFRRSREGRLVTLELGAPRGAGSSGSDASAESTRPDPLQTTAIDASVGTARSRPASANPKSTPEGTP